jgi:hypothetical protein
MPGKNHRLLLFVFVLPQLALAELPVNHQSLGTVQAVVDFCVQMKPADAAKYQEQAGLLVSGLASEELSRVREADDYKEAYATTKEALSKVDTKDAAKDCDGYLELDKADKPNQ